MSYEDVIAREHASRIPDPVPVMCDKDWYVRSFRNDVVGRGNTRESALADYEKRLSVGDTLLKADLAVRRELARRNFRVVDTDYWQQR